MNRFKNTSSLYEWISCAVPDRVYFGPLPNEYMLEQLKKNRFNVIVNLTENLDSYDISDDMKYKNKPNFTLNHFMERLDIYNSENFDYKIYNIKI